MLNRIKWAEEIAGEKKVRKRDQEHQEGERNECNLVSFFKYLCKLLLNKEGGKKLSLLINFIGIY